MVIIITSEKEMSDSINTSSATAAAALLKAGTAQTKIEEFLTLAKGQKAKALETLIEQILSNPLIYVFGEFLSQPNFQEVNLHQRYIHDSFIVRTIKQAFGDFRALCL